MVDSEVELLRDHGHEVRTYLRDNHDVEGRSRLALARDTLWAIDSHKEVSALIAEFSPHVIHVHNTLPLISPSVYWAAHRARVPVVQTLHNFRLQCPQAMLLRAGSVCEECVGRLPWRAVAHRCYRGSAAQSAAIASMLVLHRAIGTWRDRVTRYIALNDFCRERFVAGGLPARRVVVKPNFVRAGAPPDGPREGLLFVGRLSAEKGIETLAAALARSPDLSVRVAGDGPAAGRLREVPNAELLGALPVAAVMQLMERAGALVLPSVWYENFPRTIVEAFAKGLPVIASRLGAMAELIEDGRTGLLFEPADPEDLAARMRWAVAHPQQMREMGERARRTYLERYTPEANMRRLDEIYREAIDEIAGASRGVTVS